MIFNNKSSLIKVLFTVLFTTLTCSCATKNPSLPSWYYNPGITNPDILYGVGTGVNINDAKSNAINDMATKINVVISSRTVNELSFSNNTGAHQSSAQNITLNVNDLNFKNVVIEKTEATNGQVVMLVTTRRSEIINDNIAEIKNLDHKIAAIKSSIKNNATLAEKYQKMLKISQLNNTMLKHIATIESLENKNIVATQAKTDIFSFNKSLAEVTSIILVKVECQNPTLTTILYDEIDKLGLKISPNGATNSNTLIIKATVNFTSRALNNTYLAKGNFTFNFIDGKGKILASKNETASANSLMSQHEAEKSAVYALKDKFKDSDMLTVLGLY